LQHKKYYLAIYADVLQKLAQHSAQKKTAIELVDFGAGNGLLGIFAKFCGFNKVFINDIDMKFVDAAKSLAIQLEISINGFITGDIDSVENYLQNEKPTAIIGTDVIEHIYDLDHFFSVVRKINPSMVSVLTTASNPENYFKTRMLKKIQLKDELEGGTTDEHALFGEHSHEPFLKIREQIIGKHGEGLSSLKITELAKATRGLNTPDILGALQQYKLSGKMPVPPFHPTNTCNPLNGSWTERILSLEEYISLYAAAGFTCKFYAGFYNDLEGNVAERFVKKMLNAAITTVGKKISPYIVIVGEKK
jgi:2-polyprenyl-3-methyl-5-hydroxy-6-metoxy-1,4-benzoquinol methylase